MTSLGIRPYEKGLVDLGRGGYAWLQPDGGWGWSNAGLVSDGDQALTRRTPDRDEAPFLA